MDTYQGSCHCCAVKFKVEMDISSAVRCNCSICRKKGALHHRVLSNQFELLSGKNDLSLYQFNTKKAKHFFCKHCGIHPFSRSRVDPGMYSININCLDDYDSCSLDINIMEFDGKNWEEAFKNLKNSESGHE